MLVNGKIPKIGEVELINGRIEPNFLSRVSYKKLYILDLKSGIIMVLIFLP